MLESLQSVRRGEIIAALIGILIGAAMTWRVLDVVAAVPIKTMKSPQSEAAAISDLALAAANPVRLRIPAINLDVPFTGGLGLNERGEIDVPDTYTEVGWYENGPTPGEIGPAVVVGHVDSHQGPAVFYDLRNVKAGDQILIERPDEIVAVFTVTEVTQSNQKAFPTTAVYGDLPYAGLRVITCSGTYEKSKNRYSHNLIVSARLTGTTSPAVF